MASDDDDSADAILHVFHSIRTLIFIGLSITIIIFCFKANSELNKLKELKIQTYFTSQNLSDNWLINYLENDIESNEVNKYTEFFNKYNLTEGQTLYNNDTINHSYKHLSNVCLATAILLIILVALSLIPWLLFCIVSIGPENFIFLTVYISLYITIFFIIILLIIFFVFLGFFIYYKNHFEKDFFKFFEEINNTNEQTSFKRYYNSLFELKYDLLINMILNPVNIASSAFLIIFFFKCVLGNI